MNPYLFRHKLAPPSLVAHLHQLRHTLDDLGERVRERISAAVSQAVSVFVHRGVRVLLERCQLRPVYVSRPETQPWMDDEDEMFPVDDELEEPLVEVLAPAPPEAQVTGLLSASLRQVGGWLCRCRRWTGLPVLGRVLVAGAGVLGSATGLLSLTDTACAGAAVLTNLFVRRSKVQ